MVTNAMNAIVFRSEKFLERWKKVSIQIEKKTQPLPRPAEVLLRVQYCGICGSDFSMAAATANGEMQYPGLANFPLVPGHEFSAVIEGFGDGARDKWQVEDPVIAEETSGCGICEECRRGQSRFCGNIQKIGFTHDGAFAPFVRVPLSRLWSVAALTQKFGISQGMQIAALVQPYSIPFSVLFGNHTKQWMPGDSLLVIGGGPIGFAAADLAQAAGAESVVIVERDSNRREKLAAFSQKTSVEITESIPPQRSFSWIIDAAGVPDLAAELAGKAAPFGALVLLARTGHDFCVNPEILAQKNLQICSIDGHYLPDAYPRIISLMVREKLHPQWMIDKLVDLPTAEKILQTQEKGTGKILVKIEDR